MKYLGLIIGLCAAFSGMAQYGEEVGPLTANPALIDGTYKTPSAASKAAPETFDSTFIYSYDAIGVPVFDDFSTNKFEQYSIGFTDPGVTSSLEYRLLDLFSQPMLDTVYATQQVTFRRQYVESTGQFTNYPFPPVPVQLGDLSSYPVSYQTIDVYPGYYIYDSIQNVGGVDPNPDTIWVIGATIFQDSARQFFATLPDIGTIWIDNEAYHNYSMGKDPWSLGVATFDGLDSKGYPYAIGTTTTNYADHLTSKPIDMTTVAPSDSMYFSFMYQAQGYGDAPEPGDSLILQFYNKNLDIWNHIWSVNGIALDTFKLTHIPVVDPGYFTDGFQFRFVNFGGLSGSLDHFHVDYVQLRSIPFGGQVDTFLRDVAISYPIYTLLKDYTSVPWDHYKNLSNPNEKMSDAVQVVMANSFPSQISANDGTLEVYHNGSLEGSATLVSDVLCNNVNDNYFANDIPYSTHNIQSVYTFDQSKPGDLQEFEIRTEVTGGATNYFGNDSSLTTQTFKNYYSYDDGSAESAYGPTGIQARLAIQYTPYEADSLIGALIHFVPSVKDVSNNLFALTVWSDLNGHPDTVIYQDELFDLRTPKYDYGLNGFSSYFFKDTMKVAVNGTFYIGWRQLDPERLNVGLDRNLVNNQYNFYSVDGGSTWVQSPIEGSVMIRPLFSTALDGTLGIKETTLTQQSAVVYPNPTSGQLTIVPVLPFEGAVLRNLNGQVVLNSDETQMDLTNLPAGMYFLEVVGERTLHKITKY